MLRKIAIAFLFGEINIGKELCIFECEGAVFIITVDISCKAQIILLRINAKKAVAETGIILHIVPEGLRRREKMDIHTGGGKKAKEAE